MLVACVCLACDAILVGLSLPGLEPSQVTSAWDASPTELLEPGTVLSDLNILCSDVVDQKREMGWLKAGRQFPGELVVVASVRSALLELLLAASRIAQRLDRARLCHAWGL